MGYPSVTGLRLLVNVNQADYLPTTEAAGVRLVVHERDMEAFPDTFGSLLGHST